MPSHTDYSASILHLKIQVKNNCIIPSTVHNRHTQIRNLRITFIVKLKYHQFSRCDMQQLSHSHVGVWPGILVTQK